MLRSLRVCAKINSPDPLRSIESVTVYTGHSITFSFLIMGTEKRAGILVKVLIRHPTQNGTWCRWNPSVIAEKGDVAEERWRNVEERPRAVIRNRFSGKQANGVFEVITNHGSKFLVVLAHGLRSPDETGAHIAPHVFDHNRNRFVKPGGLWRQSRSREKATCDPPRATIIPASGRNRKSACQHASVCLFVLCLLVRRVEIHVDREIDELPRFLKSPKENRIGIVMKWTWQLWNVDGSIGNAKDIEKFLPSNGDRLRNW